MSQTSWFFSATRTPAILLAFVILASSLSSAEWKERVLYSFQGGADGEVPAGGVVFDKQGNLYGATTEGGSSSCEGYGQCGTVFQLVPPVKKGDAWTENLLYVFRGRQYNDGNAPNGGLVMDAAGNLYGVTAYGGSGPCELLGAPSGCGAVYQMTPPAKQGDPWTETVLYSFQGGADGHLPNGDLVFDSAGNLYGATMFGGGKGTCNGIYGFCGTVFSLSPPKTKGGKWAEKVLYSFKGVAGGKSFGDGANPNGGLVLDRTGAIYGTTCFGGNNVKGECQGEVGATGCGTVFKFTPPTQKGGKWTKQLLHQFNGHDGSNSSAGVIFDGKGNLYGTTSFGPGPYGLVFELEKPSGKAHSWKETVLHAFKGGSDGANPVAGLVFDSGGGLYGTTNIGTSQSARGNIFRLKALGREGGNWGFGVIYTFTVVPDGEHPGSNLVFDNTGDLYGTTQEGGAGAACTFGCGTVFEVLPEKSEPRYIHQRISEDSS